jgi:hypothetical protein
LKKYTKTPVHILEEYR